MSDVAPYNCFTNVAKDLCDLSLAKFQSLAGRLSRQAEQAGKLNSKYAANCIFVKVQDPIIQFNMISILIFDISFILVCLFTQPACRAFEFLQTD